MTESEIRWAKYFFDLIAVVRTKSKDKHTHIGCIIVGPDNEVRSTGYNSLPRGLNDDIAERYERPAKYDYFEHSERNAIYNAARAGIATKGCTIYLHVLPCVDCARAIIQCGITRIIYAKAEHEKFLSAKYTSKMFEISLEMLGEAKVEIIGL